VLVGASAIAYPHEWLSQANCSHDGPEAAMPHNHPGLLEIPFE
jgi:hypothetical protein